MGSMALATNKIIFCTVLSLSSCSLLEASWAQEKTCVHTEDEVIKNSFYEFYSKNTSVDAYNSLIENKDLMIYNCGYFFVIETNVKQNVFGVSDAYFFKSGTFEFIGYTAINE